MSCGKTVLLQQSLSLTKATAQISAAFSGFDLDWSLDHVEVFLITRNQFLIVPTMKAKWSPTFLWPLWQATTSKSVTYYRNADQFKTIGSIWYNQEAVCHFLQCWFYDGDNDRCGIWIVNICNMIVTTIKHSQKFVFRIQGGLSCNLIQTTPFGFTFLFKIFAIIPIRSVLGHCYMVLKQLQKEMQPFQVKSANARNVKYVRKKDHTKNIRRRFIIFTQKILITLVCHYQCRCQTSVLVKKWFEYKLHVIHFNSMIVFESMWTNIHVK